MNVLACPLNPRPVRRIFALLLCTILWHAPAAQASYRDCATGSLLTATCWNPNGVPTSTGSAEIGHASYASDVTATMTTGSFVPAYIWLAYSGYNGTVNHSGGTIGSPTSTYQISVGYGAGLTGTYNLSGTGTVNAGNTLEIGSYGTGVFTQSSATTSVTVPTYLYLGTWNSSASGTYNLQAGTLTVNDPLVSSQEVIGFYGTGSFVQTGGSHTAATINMGIQAGSSGSYNFSAGTLVAGSLYMSGAGTSTITHSGGTGTMNYLVMAAYGAGSASYNLSGSGSLTSAFGYLGGASSNQFNQSGGTASFSFLDVGYNGNFAYNQTAGTTTVSSSFVLGGYTGAMGTYNLRGGTLNANAATAISNGAGTGVLNIDGGTLSVGGAAASVNVDTLNLGSAPGYTGSHTLSGSRAINAGTMNVGLGGTGTYTQAAGTTTVSGTMTVAANAGSAGTVNLQGGSLTAASLVNKDTVNYSGGMLYAAINNLDTLNMSGGGTRALSGSLTNNGVVDVAAGTTAEFNGLVTGSGSYTGAGTSVFKGGFSPGNSPALVTMAGDAVFDSGNTLVMELAGLTPGSQYDVLDIAGDAWLGGTLDIDFLSGFNPAAGNSFDLLMASVIHGTFSSVLLPGLDPGLFWDLQYLLNPTGDDIVRLTVSAAAVPVPAAVWMFGSGLLGLGWLRRRTR